MVDLLRHLILSIEMTSPGNGQASAEGETKSLNAGFEKLDLEQAIRDRLRLPDQLIEPLFANGTPPVLVDGEPARSTGRLSIDQHTKPHRCALRGRAHDEMQVAGVKAVGDAAIGLVERRGLSPDDPITS